MPAQELDFSSSPLYKNASAQEKEAFFRFYTLAANQIAGQGDRDFWTVVVPQLAQLYPPVWHAVNAMSTVYAKDKIRGCDDVAKQNRNQYYQFALAQYGKSMEETLAVSKIDMEVIDKEIILTSCLVMCCMALLMLDRRMALQHSWHAFRLFREWCDDDDDDDLAEIDTVATQGFLTKLLKPFPDRVQQACTAPGRNGAAALQRMRRVDSIQGHVTPCVLIVELWSLELEAEFHLSFNKGQEVSYQMFLQDLEAILEMGWHAFHQNQMSQSGTASRFVIQAVIGASLTETIYCDGENHQCTHPKRFGESSMMEWPWPSDFFDAKIILDKVADGSLTKHDRLMWSDSVALGSCSCSEDDVCSEHRVSGTGVQFLEEEGIHAVMNAVSRVVGNRPGQYIRLKW